MPVMTSGCLPFERLACLALLLCLGLAVAATTSASDTTTWDVDPDGVGAYTLTEALDLATAGDVLSLADGTYNNSIETTTAGTEERPITIVGGPGAVIKSSSSPSVLISHSHIHLTGFSVDGKIADTDEAESYINKCIRVDGGDGDETPTALEGFVMTNMTVRNCGSECVRLKNYVTGAMIFENTIENCGVYDFQFDWGGKNGEAIYIGTSSNQWTYGEDKCTRNYVTANTIVTHGNECVDIKEGSSENVIEDNFCGDQLDEDAACYSSRGDNNTFRYNTATNCKGAGVRVGGWTVDDHTYGQENNVYENDILNASYSAVKLTTSPQALICGNYCEDGACDVVGSSTSGTAASTWNVECDPTELESAFEAAPFGGDASDLPTVPTPSPASTGGTTADDDDSSEVEMSSSEEEVASTPSPTPSPSDASLEPTSSAPSEITTSSSDSADDDHDDDDDDDSIDGEDDDSDVDTSEDGQDDDSGDDDNDDEDDDDGYIDDSDDDFDDDGDDYDDDDGDDYDDDDGDDYDDDDVEETSNSDDSDSASSDDDGAEDSRRRRNLRT